jgi:hypothetical protein
MESDLEQYDVALSFAGQDRRVAKRLADELRRRGISVFYDEYEQANLWGKNLFDHLDSVYGKQSQYCVILVSRHYAEGVWTNHERRAAQARAIQNNQEYILPLRLDDTELPGLNHSTAYLDVREYGPKRVATRLAEKLGIEDRGEELSTPFNLRIVDGLLLGREYRQLLKPSELMADHSGRLRRLPRFFYEIPSWEIALESGFTPHFQLWEFMNVDVREDSLHRMRWPRYIPCAAYDLALGLEVLHRRVGGHLYIASNGGYRTPGHRLSTHASPHCWGTAANIYRIGDDWLDDEKTIGRYTRTINRFLPRMYVRPFGTGPGEADDHLHVDIGFHTVVPHDAPGEEVQDSSELD